MQYFDFKDLKLSALGFGAMRLPVIDGDDNVIDEAVALEMVDYAYNHGINYFDTAWGYHGGNSERVIGRALSRYPRESFYLADKFPDQISGESDGYAAALPDKRCRALFGGRAEVCVGIIASTPRKEEALRYVRYLLS